MSSHEEIEKINLELLFEYASTLPVSPRIFARLDQLAGNDDTSLDYISSLVRMDPGLAAQVLRVTNSAYYGGPIKVNEISTAISRIGFNELRNILKNIVDHESFFQALPAYGLTATEFTEHSIDVAIISETISKRIGFDSTAPYNTGLLHEIGQLAINIYLERLDKLTDLTEAAGDEPLIEFEKRVFGMSRYRVGAELLNHWQFESSTWQPIRNLGHSGPSHIQPNATAILSLSIWMAEQLGGYDPDATFPDSIKSDLRILGIDGLDVASLLDESRFEINDRKNMLAMLL